MADQWGRQIWLAIKELTGAPIPGTAAAQLVEANYDRRDENGVEVPGVPDSSGNIPQPPVETSYLQKLFDTVQFQNPNGDISLGNARGVLAKTVSTNSVEILPDVGQRSVFASGSLFRPWLVDAPQAVSFSSDSGDDTVAGSGAQTVTITGYADSTNSDMVTETLEIYGATTVVSTTLFYRVVEFYVETGTTSNIGSITASHPRSSSGQTQVARVILPGESISQHCGFYIPRNKTALILDVSVNTSAANAQVNLEFYSGQLINLVNKFFVDATTPIASHPVGKFIPGNCDVQLVVDNVTDVTVISASIKYLLIDNDLIDFTRVGTIPGLIGV